ncbi:hypothetical protein LSTR_LSTR009585 [Laodelphax striatellus]|uniref:Uncharacterized protein n=1 Tax=Laodelphax striatellus TaxID=195883 RepID=A0A482WQ60_LAOST|nr:hypothetical protein LSTR_LSTR009585 [Laodelphax striatellus]
MKSISVCNMLLCLSMGFLLVAVDALYEDEAKLPEKIYRSYFENRNQLLADSMMKNDNLKQLLQKHHMPDPDTNTSFHEELKKIIILHLNSYFIRLQIPTLLPYIDAFIKKELIAMETPRQGKIPMRLVLKDFTKFLVDEQKKSHNLQELIDIIDRADFNFRNDLTRALLSRLDLGKMEEQKFYKDLCDAINNDEKWFSKIIIDNFFELNRNLFAIVVNMKVEVDNFFKEVNRQQ